MPPELLTAARDLCDRAFGDRFHDTDWDHALGGWHALALRGRSWWRTRRWRSGAASAAVVPAGYVEAVATEPGRQGSGLGTLVSDPVAVIRARPSWARCSTGAHGFYQRLGWERWRGPTYVRGDGDRCAPPRRTRE